MAKYKEYTGLWALSKEKQRILKEQKKYNENVREQIKQLNNGMKILSKSRQTLNP